MAKATATRSAELCGYESQIRSFIKLVEKLSHRHNVHQVFRDFVGLAARTLHNQLVEFLEELEAEYLEIAKRYSATEMCVMAELLGITQIALGDDHCDFLGDCYMRLEIGNAKAGQYFSPFELAKMMALMVHGDEVIRIARENGFVTLLEPASGSGVMVIAMAKVMREAELDPAKVLYVSTYDIDATVAEMCYIQLCCLDIPAHVYIGNFLSGEVRRVYPTPALKRNGWVKRLLQRYEEQSASEQPAVASDAMDEAPKPSPVPDVLRKIPGTADVQLALF